MDLQLQHRGKRSNLGQKAAKTVAYHSLFDYPLTPKELLKWAVGKKVKIKEDTSPVKYQNGYYFMRDKEIIFKRALNEISSRKKMIIAKKAARVLSQVPSIMLVAISGSLAMQHAAAEADIDLMVVTAKGTLWTTRLISYFLLKAKGFKIRKAGVRKEKDKLCLNLWLDEAFLNWDKRNIFTAHEICQLIPIANKNKTYERFVWENKWVQDYWPKAVKISKRSLKLANKFSFWVKLMNLVEPLSFWFQYLYMRDKITSEVVTPTKALFHPVDWSSLVNSKIKPT